MRLARVVATTAVFNLATTAAAGLTGVLVARTVGADVRGQYAAVVAWLGVLAMFGQVGQPHAVAYHVARNPGRAKEYVASSRLWAIAGGTLAAGAGVVVAPFLAGGQSGLAVAYQVTFVGCLLVGMGTAYTYGLQAVDLRAWNLVRLSQPVMYLTVMAVLAALGRMTLMAALWSLVGTLAVQAVAAYVVARLRGLAGGQGFTDLVRPVGRYGMQQFATGTAAAPVFVVLRLDQLVLSVAVAPAALGHYAVAATLTTLAAPVAAAVGNVAFPRLASRTITADRAAHLRRTAIVVSLAIGCAIMAVVAASAFWVVPFVFGPDFRDAVPLVLLLAPGGVFLACTQVCGDLLRGQGRPLAVARATIITVAALAALLATLIPVAGVVGAAAASSGAAAIGLVALLWELRRPFPTATPAPENAPVGVR